jgi:hypothetical protein
MPGSSTILDKASNCYFHRRRFRFPVVMSLLSSFLDGIGLVRVCCSKNLDQVNGVAVDFAREAYINYLALALTVLDQLA